MGTILGPSDRYFAADGPDRVESTVTFAARGGETFTNRASHAPDAFGRVRWSVDGRGEDPERAGAEER